MPVQMCCRLLPAWLDMGIRVISSRCDVKLSLVGNVGACWYPCLMCAAGVTKGYVRVCCTACCITEACMGDQEHKRKSPCSGGLGWTVASGCGRSQWWMKVEAVCSTDLSRGAHGLLAHLALVHVAWTLVVV